jgi:MFS superfamily sulfate permease-like transporter
MLGYALLGRSTALVVSATTATSALSAAAVGPLAHGDAIKFAALSAALALVAAAVLAAAGLLRLGGIADLVPQSVMTGASQTAAAQSAGGKSQLATVIAAGLILLTGAFLAPLLKDLPQATLSAIVIVAVSGFFRVDEIRRYAKLRRSALVMSLVALVGVLALGVLPGLLVAAGLSLIAVIHMLSRPTMGELARDPGTGAWGRADRHPDWPGPRTSSPYASTARCSTATACTSKRACCGSSSTRIHARTPCCSSCRRAQTWISRRST